MGFTTNRRSITFESPKCRIIKNPSMSATGLQFEYVNRNECPSQSAGACDSFMLLSRHCQPSLPIGPTCLPYQYSDCSFNTISLGPKNEANRPRKSVSRSRRSAKTSMGRFCSLDLFFKFHTYVIKFLRFN
jgi:hypothetical protein